MRRAAVAVLVGITAAISQPTYAITGNEWLKLNETARSYFVMGVVDTWRHLSSTVKDSGGPERDKVFTRAYLAAHNCLKDEMTYVQIIAIVEKWMRDNPQDWHYDMASNIWAAIGVTCNK